VLSVFRVPSERAQPKLRSVYCAALPSLGLLAPGNSGSGIWKPNASLYETSWIPKGTMGIPSGTRLQSARLGRRKGQGKIAKSRARKKDQEGKAKQYKTRQGKTRQDKTNQGNTRQDKTNEGKTKHDKTRQDKSSQDKTRQDTRRQDKTRQDKTRQDKTR
jgi:hypothetical protein